MGRETGSARSNGFANWRKNFATNITTRVFIAFSGTATKTIRSSSGFNEFLFDVMVCSVSGVESLQRRSNRLDFIDQCHWQVESEFNRDNSRAIIVDMSKLVVRSAANKLFIASYRDRPEPDLLELCAKIAPRCSGNVYLAFVAHPEDWASDPKEPVLYEWLAGDWEPMLRQS